MQNTHGCLSDATLAQVHEKRILRCINYRLEGLSGARKSLERKDLHMSFKLIGQRLANWRRYRAAVRELSLLSDRELADLGLSRYDIEMVARQSACR